jgi:type VI secretion system protein ImpA
MQLWQFGQSAELAAIVDPERRQQRIAAGVIPFDTAEAEARAAGTAHFTTLHEQAETAVTAWRALGEALDVRAGADAPPTSQVREILEQLTGIAARYGAPGGASAAASEAAVGDDASAPSATGQIGASVSTSLASREEALRSLAAIADFFRRTEPLSPLSYTLQEAVRRARMSWPELLEEIVPDAGVRGQILISLGIQPPPPSE